MSRKASGKNRRNGDLVLFPELESKDANASGKPAYEPLPSTWDGTDAELLERMLDFYPKNPPRKILDATVNAGRFWVGSHRNVTGLDIDPRHKPDVVADNTDMPFEDSSFDVIDAAMIPTFDGRRPSATRSSSSDGGHPARDRCR